MANVQTSVERRTTRKSIPTTSSASSKREPAVNVFSPNKLRRDSYFLPAPVMFSSVVTLEDAADQLAVLGSIGNLPQVEDDLTYKTLESRFNHKITDTYIFDRETIDPYEVALNREKLVKFQKDRSYAENILRGTITQLLRENNYEVLTKYIAQHDRQVEEEMELLENETVNKIKLMEIKNLLEKERQESLSAIQNFSEIIGKLKDHLEDLYFENKIKSNYIEAWENSRIEQNTIALNKQEEYYINAINKKKLDIEQEMRIDAEIEAFITQTQQEYQESIQMWMERYDKELEQRDFEIQVLKEKREEQFTKLHQLSKLYEDHKLQIEQYLEFKENRRKEEELIMRRHQAATKIQAWWKGMMVRKCLGEFANLKKKGKGKGSDKKKGK